MESLLTVRCQCGACPACQAPYQAKPLPDIDLTLVWHVCEECDARWGHVLPDHDEAQGAYDDETWAQTTPPSPIVG